MLYGKVPWPDDSFYNYMTKIRQKEPIEFPKTLHSVSEDTKSFIRACLQYEESQRIDWDEMLSHSLIQKYLANQNDNPQIASSNPQTLVNTGSPVLNTNQSSNADANPNNSMQVLNNTTTQKSKIKLLAGDGSTNNVASPMPSMQKPPLKVFEDSTAEPNNNTLKELTDNFKWKLHFLRDLLTAKMNFELDTSKSHLPLEIIELASNNPDTNRLSTLLIQSLQETIDKLLKSATSLNADDKSIADLKQVWEKELKAYQLPIEQKSSLKKSTIINLPSLVSKIKDDFIRVIMKGKNDFYNRMMLYTKFVVYLFYLDKLQKNIETFENTYKSLNENEYNTIGTEKESLFDNIQVGLEKCEDKSSSHPKVKF